MSEHEAVINLREHQLQLDADGCMVGVSRQALEETFDLITAMQERIAELEADLSQALDDHADTGKALLESKKRISALEKEVRYLRTYGNKDCTAQADEAMKNNTLEQGE